MVDNITAPAVGTVLATDDIGGVHYPRTKISFGADGAATDVASGAPFPVTLGLTDAQLRATPVPVSGTVAVTGAFFQVTQPVSGTVGVSGSVAVSGTFFQATQPVSAVSLPLPTGAATQATLASVLASLQTTEPITSIVAVTPSATAFAATRALIASANMTADLTVGGVDINGVTLTIGINPIAATKVRAVTGGTVMRAN